MVNIFIQTYGVRIDLRGSKLANESPLLGMPMRVKYHQHVAVPTLGELLTEKAILESCC